MPTPKRGPRLVGGPAQQRAMLRNQATELFRHGRIKTTETRAKLLRPYAERLITKAKAGDLHKRRQVLSELRDRDVVAHLFEEVAPRFEDRDGGYTRILKLGPRKGDNAPMALIELVEQGEGSAEEVIEEAKASRTRGLFRRRPSGGAEAVAFADHDHDHDEHDHDHESDDSLDSEESEDGVESDDSVEDAESASESEDADSESEDG